MPEMFDTQTYIRTKLLTPTYTKTQTHRQTNTNNLKMLLHSFIQIIKTNQTLTLSTFVFFSTFEYEENNTRREKNNKQNLIDIQMIQKEQMLPIQY